jgi:hypothetical protein
MNVGCASDRVMDGPQTEDRMKSVRMPSYIIMLAIK